MVETIAREEAKLARLDAERSEKGKRLAALRSELTSLCTESGMHGQPPAAPQVQVPRTPAEKVKLFRSLFRGREDVFPTRFVSKKTGKPGYAPACRNKFVRGVCGLPAVKCGECPNQAFLPVDDRAVADHLRGRHVMGVYPLLKDEACWFLAIDFDKASWKGDVLAFMATCRLTGVPVAVERSRSGSGGHAWVFFASQVPASAARKMGCFLITETMARHHELGMESYDRLFPNQDTVPRGGFGNLIALPLQGDARARGNTVFLDDELEPYPDQWAFLASVGRMDPAAVEAMAREATRKGQVLGLPDDESLDEGGRAPWDRAPSGRSQRIVITDPLPREVRAVLAQRLYIERDGLPPALINQIKRLAAFQNPEFYARQGMRLSTALTPRVISCAEELPGHIALPRGCRDALQALLQQHGVALQLDDRRYEGEPAPFRFDGDLTALQKKATRAVLRHDIGVVVAPPGVGKTVLGTRLVAARGRRTLILVHRRPLLEQWVAQLSMFIGIDDKDIGRIGGGKRKPNGRLDVAMIQSLVRKGTANDLVAEYGHVIVDECHHVPAVSFERVLSEVKARYVVGLTATRQRRDGHHPIIEMQLGPVRFSVDAMSPSARRPFEHNLVVRHTGFQLAGGMGDGRIQQVYRLLAMDESRNQMILNDVVRAIKDRRFPIILTERRDHLEYLAERLRGAVRHLVVLHGGSPNRRRPSATTLTDVLDGEEFLVLATGRYAGEGFDDARLDTLFLAMPISWKGTLIQYAGRLQRVHPRKSEVRIFDYVDREVPVLRRMFEKRLRTYRAIGYARGSARLGNGELVEEPAFAAEQKLLHLSEGEV
ncbi:MAG: DEAD/DEAH box helicase family protein [Gemmatimonadetes bacterium]|nr:DEAD/DEAH box helicase family protein [Gemmatimonadota bacterium]